MRCMTALALREHFDVCNHSRLGLFVRVTILQRDPGGFSGRKEALGPGVVPPVALATPTRLPPLLRQEWSRALSPLRTATVRRHDAPRSRLARTNRPRQGLGHALCPPLVGHGPPDHGSRTQRQPHGERPPAFARGQAGHSADVNRLWGVPRARPVQLVRGHRLRLPCGLGGFAWAPRLAAPARRGPDAPAAAPAALQAGRRQQRRAAARAGGATPRRTIGLEVVVPLLSARRWRPGGTAAPRRGAPARARQARTQATALQGGLRLWQPRVLSGSGCAKDAAAFWKLSRSSFPRAFAFRRRCSASESWS
jgi:hypothetical protein